MGEVATVNILSVQPVDVEHPEACRVITRNSESTPNCLPAVLSVCLRARRLMRERNCSLHDCIPEGGVHGDQADQYNSDREHDLNRRFHPRAVADVPRSQPENDESRKREAEDLSADEGHERCNGSYRGEDPPPRSTAPTLRHYCNSDQRQCGINDECSSEPEVAAD